MKKIKLILGLGLLCFIALQITIYIVRKPSYTIKTDGKLYIVNKSSSSITVFDLYQGKEITEIPIGIVPHDPTTLKNQSKVVVTNYGTPEVLGKSITVINTKNNKIQKTIELQGSIAPHGIVPFPNSNKVAVVTDIGNNLVVVDIEKGIVEKNIPTQQILSHLVVLDPKKPLAYVTNINSGSVSVIDLQLEKVIKIIHCGFKTEGIDITPDGSEIWVTNHKENTISVINTASCQITNTLPCGKESLRLKFSVDGKHCLVTNASDGTISVYDRKTKKQIKTILLHGKTNLIEKLFYHTPRPVGLLIHPNGLYAFVANSNANKVEVIDMKTFTVVSNIGTGKMPDGLAVIN
jgi:YVTN family beta-propeller protein